MKSAVVFWDEMAEKYSRDPVKNMENYEDTLTRTKAYLRDSDAVLEIACGTGSTALLLAPSVSEYLATDVSGEMVRIGRDKTKAAGIKNLSFGTGTASKGAHTDTTYDAILSFNFIHLADDPQADVRSIFDMVNSGGYFISKTACMGEWPRILRPLIWFAQKIGKAPFLAYFDRSELDQMILDAGFEIVETHSYPVSPVSHFVVARRP